MAGLKDADDFKDGERFKGAGGLGLLALLVGVGATVAFFLMAMSSGEPEEGKSYSQQDGMAFSWLFAVVYFLTLAVGGLFWTLLHHATNSGWGTVVRRQMENIGILIPIMLLLGLPMILPLQQLGFRDVLWEWFPDREEAESIAEKKAEKEKDAYIAEIKKKAKAAAAAVTAEEKKKAEQGELSPGFARFFDDKIKALQNKAEELQAHEDEGEEALFAELKDKYFQKESALLYAKRGYLNGQFWYIRFVIYGLVLGGSIFLLRSMSVRQDKTGEPSIFRKMRAMSCLFLLPFALAWTFLAFDWLMGLDYSWFSTMWGVYLFAGAALNSMGLLILLVSWLRGKGYLEKVVTKEHYLIKGKLMHAFVIFWAYIAFSQFFLIWYANITEETKFFLTRNTGFWNMYSIMFLVVGHFFIPFVVLLLRHHKTTAWIICSVAIWNLIMHAFDIYWIVVAERAPSLTHGEMTRIPGMWMFDALAFVAVGGIFVFCLLKVLGSASLFPCRDPRLDESLNLTN